MPRRKKTGNGQTGGSSPDLGLGDVSGMVGTLLDKSRRHPSARLSSIAPPLEKLSEGLNGDRLNGRIAELRELISDIRNDTENAANAIMDACEAIRDRDDADAPVAEIFTACGFQDIVGQRCSKALSLIDSIVDGTPPAEADGRSEEVAAGLLDGPSGSNARPSQDEIDKLFSGAGDG
ncbi:MAG: hypothetical protein RJQ21_19320 [Rhodospirillales bacterium]